jgi:hypothetical protein
MTLDAETLDAEKIGCKKDRETIHAKVEVRYGRDYYLPPEFLCFEAAL